jgi:hypothetical protein
MLRLHEEHEVPLVQILFLVMLRLQLLQQAVVEVVLIPVLSMRMCLPDRMVGLVVAAL